MLLYEIWGSFQAGHSKPGEYRRGLLVNEVNVAWTISFTSTINSKRVLNRSQVCFQRGKCLNFKLNFSNTPNLHNYYQSYLISRKSVSFKTTHLGSPEKSIYTEIEINVRTVQSLFILMGSVCRNSNLARVPWFDFYRWQKNPKIRSQEENTEAEIFWM